MAQAECRCPSVELIDPWVMYSENTCHQLGEKKYTLLVYLPLRELQLQRRIT
jgi:hypothetical protein